MLVPPRYRLTKQVVSLLQQIEANKEVVNSIDIPIEIENNIRRASTLKSSLFSARIEGNDLTLDDYDSRSSSDQRKIEIFNILKSINYLRKKESKDTTLAEILETHAIAMKGLNYEAGKLRRENSATFNQAGIAVYMHPPPRQINSNLKKLIKFINSEKEEFVPIRACLAHFSFEKIHPFLDGNGRLGRLVLQKTLMKGGFGFKGLLAFEEYIDNHRSEYYRSLEEPEKDCTDYLIFMLSAIAEKSTEAKNLVLAKKESSVEDYLLPRRAEIFNIIREQKLINFESIKRRFNKVNSRTLRYDLKKLQDNNLIKKRGATKGVYYEAS